MADLGCGQCLAVDAPVIDDAVDHALPITLHPQIAGTAAGFFAAHPVAILSDLPEGTPFTVDVTGDLVLYDETGALTDAPGRTFYVGAVGTGEGAIAVHTEACDATDGLSFRAIAAPQLVGRDLADSFPFLDPVTTFLHDETVSAALDPLHYPERAGATLSAWVVAHQSAETWLADPTLVDAGSGPVELTLDGASLADQVWAVWADLPDAGTGAAYDLVLDADGSGTLSPGDLIDGLDEPGFWVLGDLVGRGPHDVETTSYSGGQWLGQRTYYPRDIEAMADVPIVIMSHGNGHDYTWYDYLGEHLASWGYVMMSHQNNTGPGVVSASKTTLSNTEYLLEHLGDIDGGVLEGHVDRNRIAWLGHSRGGEGVVIAYDDLVDGDESSPEYTEDDIVLVASIAPTVFEPLSTADAHEVPYFLIAGSGDGDVNGGPDCSQCQYMRIPSHAQGRVSTMLLQGVGHNEFNCCGFNDTTGPDQIGRTATQELAKGYFLALIEHFVQGNPATRELFTRGYDSFHPPELDPDIIASSTWTEPDAGPRFAIDDFEDNLDMITSSSGAYVGLTVDDPWEDQLIDQDEQFAHNSSDEMNGATQARDDDPQQRGLVFSWDDSLKDPAALFELPAGSGDLTGFHAVQLRAAQGTRHPLTVDLDGPLDFHLTLIDAAGAEVSVATALYATVPPPYLRSGEGQGQGWANEFVTVRIPLGAFVADGTGLDLSDVAAVRLDFARDGASPLGRLMIDDLVLTVD